MGSLKFWSVVAIIALIVSCCGYKVGTFFPLEEPVKPLVTSAEVPPLTKPIKPVEVEDTAPPLKPISAMENLGSTKPRPKPQLGPPFPDRLTQEQTQRTLAEIARANNQRRQESAGHKRVIIVSIDEQQLYAVQDGDAVMEFKCSTSSTGISVYPGDPNPSEPHDHIGIFKILDKNKDAYSNTYQTPMPFALHYFGGHYIHATQEIDRLGTPASHGCIRLHPRDAEELFYWARVGDKLIIQKEQVDIP